LFVKPEVCQPAAPKSCASVGTPLGQRLRALARSRELFVLVLEEALLSLRHEAGRSDGWDRARWNSEPYAGSVQGACVSACSKTTLFSASLSMFGLVARPYSKQCR
jgi:hypothetical protein